MNRLMFRLRLQLAVTACIAMWLARPALAEPFANPGFLARLEATQSYCAGIDPATTKDGAAFVAALTSQISPDELKMARDSDEYRQEYDAASAELAQADPKQAAQTCGLASKGR